MYDITLKHAGKVHKTFGCKGVTCPRDLQKLAADLWGDGAQFEISAPSVGLYVRDTARA